MPDQAQMLMEFRHPPAARVSAAYPGVAPISVTASIAYLGLNTLAIGQGDMGTDGHKPDEGLSKAQLAICGETGRLPLKPLNSG